MYEKFDQSLENVIHIHKNINEMQAKSLLLAEAKQAEAKYGKKNLVDEQKLWLLRYSSVVGLITFESIVYNKANDQWVVRPPTRYMNSAQGWVINNKAPNSLEFDHIVNQSGGKKDISDNDSVLIESLVIHILETKKCSIDDHISPLVKKKIQVMAKSRNVEEEKDFSLPDYLANTLICSLTKEEREASGLHGEAVPFMKNPVVLKDDGKTYERDVLVARYKELGIDLTEGNHYYNNLVLKHIIGYFAEKSPTDYLKMLGEIDEEVLIDSLGLEHFNKPVVSPSGFSFSKGTIIQYINSKKIGVMAPIVADPIIPDVKIGEMDLIPNENLELFVKLWPDFYETMGSQIELK